MRYSEPKTQRTKGFLLQGKEDGVQELEIFEIVIDHIVEFHFLPTGMRYQERKRRQDKRTGVQDFSSQRAE